MEHYGTQKLETERLILRRFCKNDADDCFINYAADEELYLFISDTVKTRDYIENEWLASADEAYAENDTYYWAIEVKGENKVIGEIFVDDYGTSNRWCELDWKIGRAYWNNGYATEAAKAVTEYLFNTVGFHRIQAKCAAENIGSERVMQKLGMTREGVLREFFRGKDGCYHDVVIYSLLRNEVL